MDIAADTSQVERGVVGHVVTASSEHSRGEVLIGGGRIIDVLSHPAANPAWERDDHGSSLIFPGAIDPHVHCLSYEGEGVAAATRSAAAGGVTTILEMPFDATGPIWTVDAFNGKRRMAEGESHVDFGMYATVKPGGPGQDEISGLAEAGACCFKVSTYHTDTNRFPRTPDYELIEVFAKIAKTGLRICVHTENDEVVRHLVEELREKGQTDPLAHCAARPPVTEFGEVAKVLEQASLADTKVHFCHISTPRAVELVAWHRSGGSAASVEVCPHYLTLTSEDMAERGAWLKCNPPLRDQSAVDGLWEQVAAGHVDAIASDHAPWPKHMKDKENIFDNASGGPGVETLVPVLLTEGMRRGVPLPVLATAFSHRVAETFGLSHRKGDIREGLDADLVVVDASQDWVLDEATLHSTAGWSPFHGRTLRARVAATYLRGSMVWDGASVLSQPGTGQFLTPSQQFTGRA